MQLVLSKHGSEYSNTRRFAQNPTSLQLFLNDFIVSGSSLHKFKTCKDYIFQHRMCCLLKIDGEMTQK